MKARAKGAKGQRLLNSEESCDMFSFFQLLSAALNLHFLYTNVESAGDKAVALTVAASYWVLEALGQTFASPNRLKSCLLTEPLPEIG